MAERRLGIVEAFVSVRDQCPNGSVQAVARSALEAVKTGGASTLREQAFFVLTAVRGWQGERAQAVKDALEAFLADPPQSDADKDV